MLMPRPAGFTMIELLITMALAAILIALGVPAMRGVIENGRIRTAGESWKYGITLARNEAVRLNAPVEFVTDATGWQVRRITDGTILHRGSGKEGASGLSMAFAPAGSDRITYDAFGRNPAVNPSDGSAPFTQVDIESSNPQTVSGYRPLRLQILAGGMSRLCDPAVDATDPRTCL